MLNAIGASSTQYPSSTRKSTAVLDAQLTQYQRQLSDWVNCPSCTTPDGKAKIADLSGKIGAIQQEIKASEAAQLPSRSAGIGATDSASTSSTISPSGTGAGINGRGGAPASEVVQRTAGTSVRYLDVYA